MSLIKTRSNFRALFYLVKTNQTFVVCFLLTGMANSRIEMARLENRFDY